MADGWPLRNRARRALTLHPAHYTTQHKTNGTLVGIGVGLDVGKGVGLSYGSK